LNQAVFIRNLLQINEFFKHNERHIKRGFTSDMYDNAARMYIFSILDERTHAGRRPCAKDPPLAQNISLLHGLFPHGKFIYMVRDPRAHLVSYIHHEEKQLNEMNKRAGLLSWNEFNERAHKQCMQVGAESCLLVHYERLILDFNRTMSGVARFLNVPWTDRFLHHERFVDTRIKLAPVVEWSTEQVMRPVNSHSLHSWKNKTRFDVIMVERLAPMHKLFGYNLRKDDYHYLV
jgi:hypothetical protein